MQFLRMFAAACALLMAPSAFAQAASPPPPSAAQLDAAQDFLKAALIDTGAIDASVQQAFANLGPQMRTNVQAQPYFTQATPAHQQAVLAYLDRLPAIVLDEMQQRMPGVVAGGAPAMAQIFSEADARSGAAFLRTPEGRSIFLRSAIQGANNATGGAGAIAPPTEAETQAALAFNATPAGQALSAHAEEFSAAILSTM